jgi:hypothetical protein
VIANLLERPHHVESNAPVVRDGAVVAELEVAVDAIAHVLGEVAI